MASKTTVNNIMKIELSAAVVPVFKEVKNKDWILYGKDNDYPDYLLYLLSGSSKHNAIVKGKVDYIIGSGVEVKSNGTVADKATALNILNNISKSEDFYQQFKKVAYDYEIFNGFALEVVPSNGGGLGSINHLDYTKLRLSKDGKGVYFSNDWSDYNQGEKTGLKLLPLFNEATKKGVIYFREYSPSLNYYPLPEYVGSINYIDIDKRISSWHLNNLANGFSAGTLINFATGEPTKEEKIDIERRLKSKFSGDENAGEIVITFSNGADRAPQVLSLQPNNFDKMFQELNMTVQQEIFSGHRVTSPMLLGIKTEGQLGGRSELGEAHELFMIQYVGSRQKTIESTYNYIFEKYALGIEVEIIEKKTLKDQLSENVLATILTKDELRALAGYAPLKEQIKMSATDKVYTSLASCGVNAEDYEIIKTLGYVNDAKDAKLGEIRFFKESFLDEKETKVLSLLKDNPTLGVGEIAKALEIPLGESMDIIDSLVKQELIKGKVGIEITISPKGQESLDVSVVETIEVKYQYDVRPDKGAKIIKGSRSYCRDLVSLDRLYSREEITMASNDQGTNAWTYRGGWYHDPDKDVNLPYCRHIWKQILTTKKNG